MRKIYFLIAFILTNHVSRGQNDNQEDWTAIPDFAPKSPEATAFQKYGDYKVNLSKGIADISIPLYTLNAGNFALPIALTYQPTGIKTNQEATWVGLGWSLQAGAQIILDVRDTPDENSVGLLPDQQVVNSYLGTLNDWNYCDPQLAFYRDRSWVKDVYHFSSPTASGKFIIGDSQGDYIHVYPPEAFKVETDGGVHTRRFKITDIQGNEYFFNNTREISNSVGVSGSLYYTSAWYVDQIKTATNNVINFNYINDGWHAKTNISDQIVKSSTWDTCKPISTIIETISASEPLNSSSVTKTYKISSIEHNDVRILFESSPTARLDLVSPSQLALAQYPNQLAAPTCLKFVKIQHKANNTYDLFKGYELAYTYFDSGGNIPEYQKKRLKLTEVTDLRDDMLSTLLSYSEVALPAKNTRSIDAWGYFNSAANLTTVPLQTTPANGTIRVLGSANRKVNPSVMQAGILTEIKYPSRGKTKFIYEPNQYYGKDDISNYNQKIINSHIIQGTGTPNGNPVLGTGTLPQCFSSICPVYEIIPYTMGGSGNGTLKFDFVYSGGGILTQNKYQYARVRIFNETYSTLIYDSGGIKGSRSIERQVLLNGPGNIVIEAYGQYMSVNNFQLKYVDNDYTLKNVDGPGLRIKEIQNYTSDNKLALKRRFSYTLPGQDIRSSGQLIFDAVRKFDPETFQRFAGINCPPSEDTTIAFFAWRISSSTIFRGQSPYFLMNEVSYTNVTEEIIDTFSAESNGYTLYEFDFNKCSASQDGSINIEYDWLRGNLIRKRVYKAGNKITHEEINSYIDDPRKTAVVAGFKLYFRDSYINCPTIGHPAPGTRPFENMGYSYTIPWHYLKSKEVIETMYNADNTVNGTVETTTTYNYDNPSHLQVSSIASTNSRGENTEIKYFYPGDSEVNSEPFIMNLTDKNILHPLKIQTFNAGNKINEKKKVYKNWGTPALPLYFTELVQESKSTENPETKLTFLEVDRENGNVLRLKQENGIEIIYIYMAMEAVIR